MHITQFHVSSESQVSWCDYGLDIYNFTLLWSSCLGIHTPPTYNLNFLNVSDSLSYLAQGYTKPLRVCFYMDIKI